MSFSMMKLFLSTIFFRGWLCNGMKLDFDRLRFLMIVFSISLFGMVGFDSLFNDLLVCWHVNVYSFIIVGNDECFFFGDLDTLQCLCHSFRKVIFDFSLDLSFLFSLFVLKYLYYFPDFIVGFVFLVAFFKKKI